MDLREAFIRATEEICKNLDISGEPEYRYFETKSMGLDYSARLHTNEIGFDFSIRTDTEEEDPTSGIMRAFFVYDFDRALASFVFSEDITHQKIHPNFLGRWAFWAIYNFRLNHMRINLNSVFHDSIIRVYGNSPNGLGREFDVLKEGIISVQEENVICYKIGHIQRDDNYRDLSYALFINGEWWFFPNCVGLDSGGAYMEYNRMEELLSILNDKVGVEIRRVDLDYNELKYFLLQYSDNFFTTYREDANNVLSIWDEPYRVIDSSELPFVSFKNRYERREYPQALRDLRALVQQAQVNVLLKNNVGIPDRPDINKLANALVSNKIIDGRLLHWFLSFTSIANLASHGDFPSDSDMNNTAVRRRVFMGFKLGIHLLKELDTLV